MAAKNDFSGHVISLASFIAVIAVSWLLFRKFKDDWDKEHAMSANTGQAQPLVTSSPNLLQQPARPSGQTVANTISQGYEKSKKHLTAADYLKQSPQQRLKVADRLAGVKMNGGLNGRDNALLEDLLGSVTSLSVPAFRKNVQGWLKSAGYGSLLDSKIANVNPNTPQQTAFMTRAGNLKLIKVSLFGWN